MSERKSAGMVVLALEPDGATRDLVCAAIGTAIAIASAAKAKSELREGSRGFRNWLMGCPPIIGTRY
jgi:hypothetical protein